MKKRYLTDQQIATRAWYVVYRLVNPLNSQVCYVGQTAMPYTRSKHHCTTPSNRAMTPWLQQLKELGLQPVFEIIEDGLKYRQSLDRERYWIRAYRLQGYQLFNKYPLQ